MTRCDYLACKCNELILNYKFQQINDFTIYCHLLKHGLLLIWYFGVDKNSSSSFAFAFSVAYWLV